MTVNKLQAISNRRLNILTSPIKLNIKTFPFYKSNILFKFLTYAKSLNQLHKSLYMKNSGL